MRIAIIGAGLAGCALAYVLKQAGAEPVIYEAGGEIAPEASGNPVGLYNPRFTAEFGAEAQFYSAAFEKALGVFAALEDVDWNLCGALHLINDEKKEKRFAQTASNWPSPAMRIVDVQEASEIAGVKLSHAALYLPRSGSVSPKKLCAAYARGIEVNLKTYVPSLDALEADGVVLACGLGVLGFYPMMPLKAVRGQVSMVKASAESAKLRTNLCYGGYTSAPQNGVHMVGSTFQRWLAHTDLLPEDDADNLAKLTVHVPQFAELEIVASRAALRTASADHFPVVGQTGENLYVSTAHGSHGILSSLMAAHVIVDAILGRKSSLAPDVLKSLSPDRF